MVRQIPGKVDMDKLVSLCKRRGYIFPSSEIYGGLGACYDYGPLGVELKNNIKACWWRTVVQERDDIVGLDASILMHPQTWVASGHVAGFADPLVECKQCHQRWRATDIAGRKCPACGGELTEPRMFNLMFRTHIGPVEDEAALVYLRPETAQGIFVNFQNVLTTIRKKLPVGIAQIGKAFRNEITTGNFIFRLREFEQMEIEYFVKPGTDEEWFKHWVEERFNWYVNLGIKKENIRLRQHTKDELAHYAKAAVDVRYNFPFGWQEIEGIHNRTDFDLNAHQKLSGKELLYFNQETNEKFIPWVIETSAGVERSCLVALCDAYSEDEIGGEKRTVLRFKPQVAPIKVGIFPLQKNPDLVETAQRLYKELKELWNVQYDLAGNIGRRYRRQDEIGTPFCVTIDFDTIQDQAVTIRERDTTEQVRVGLDKVKGLLMERLT